MKNPVLAQLEELRSARDTARDAAIAMATAEDFDPQDRSYLDLEERAVKLDTQIESLVGLLERQKSADALDGKLSRSATRVEERAAAPESWVDTFLNSDAFRSYNYRGNMPKVEVEMRALPHTLSDMSGVLAAPPVIDTTPRPTPNLILPLVNQVSVSGNSVSYVSYAKVAGSAAVVAEGALKPSVEWAPTVTDASLETVAAHTSISRQLAQDSTAVRSFLTGELQNEVRREVEENAVAAITAATLPTAVGPAGAGLLGAIRAGMAAVQAEGFSPNGFLVSSDDLITLDLAVMNTAGTGPNQTNAFWGLRPVVDTAGVVAAGTVLVGDFAQGVHHYTRTAVELFATDSHASNFTLNILDFIAECRVKTVVVRPNALVEATEDAA